MNRTTFRIVAWALLGLHLADALLISGGRWLASYAHRHSELCGHKCAVGHGCGHHHEVASESVCQAKRACCGHHHHRAKKGPVEESSTPSLEHPTQYDGFCDQCAACRHERQSLQMGQTVPIVAVQPLVGLATAESPCDPALTHVSAFHSRGPPAVAL